MRAKTVVNLRSLTALTILFLPALLALGLILRYAVDVPHWDDWGTPGRAYEMILRGDWDFYHIFFIQSLETRSVIPRIIWVLVSFTVGWHVTVFMVVSWLFVFVTFVAFLKLIPSGRVRRPLMFRCVALLIGCLLFSSVQWKNWLWATQLVQFVPALCLALALWIQVSQMSLGRKVIYSAILSAVATYSTPNGMLCWILAFPFLLIPFREWRTLGRQRTRIVGWLLAYLGMGVLAIGLYFVDYTKPQDTPPLDVVLQDPMLGLRCLLVWLGAPFVGVQSLPGSHLDVQATLPVGVVVLSLFSVALILLWVRRRHDSYTPLRTGWPWVCVGGFGIGTGVVTAISRAGRGIGDMLAPRYYTHSLLVAIGLVGIGYVLWRSWRGRGRLVSNVGFGIVTGLVALSALHSWIHGVGWMRTFNAELRQNLLTLHLVHVVPDNPLWKRLTLMPRCLPRARFFIDEGFLAPGRLVGWITDKVRRPDPGVGGRFRIVAESERHLRIEGWATLPGQERPADCVILAKIDPRGNVEIITGLVTNESSPDATIRGDAPSPFHTVFAETIEQSYYEEHGLVMFAVDLDGQRAYRLDHDIDASKSVPYSFAYHLDSAEIEEQRPGLVDREEFSFLIAGDRRWCLSQHPDSEIVFRNVFVAEGARLQFGAGIHEFAWDHPSDGVMFEIKLVDQESKSTTVFSQWIDPKNNLSDRRWFDRDIDLSRFAGQEITFHFKTTCGPAKNADRDWSGWSRPQLAYQGNRERGTGLVSLSFPSRLMRLNHPMSEKRLGLEGLRWRSRISGELNFGVPLGMRFSSSDPKVIELGDDRRIIPHGGGAVDIVATNGEIEARMRVETAWAPVIPLRAGFPGKGGIVPVLDTAAQEPTLGNANFVLRVSGVVGGARGMLLRIEDPATKIISDATGLLPTQGKRFSLIVGGPKGGIGEGRATFAVPIPNIPEFRGRMEFWQGFFQDHEAKHGWSVTNGVLVTVK